MTAEKHINLIAPKMGLIEQPVKFHQKTTSRPPAASLMEGSAYIGPCAGSEHCKQMHCLTLFKKYRISTSLHCCVCVSLFLDEQHSDAVYYYPILSPQNSGDPLKTFYNKKSTFQDPRKASEWVGRGTSQVKPLRR